MMHTQPRKPAAATATDHDGYGRRQAFLHHRKTTRGDAWRWIDENECDGLRHGAYSIAYQLRHARSHACFSNVAEA
jgi:hypothetical protein